MLSGQKLPPFSLVDMTQLVILTHVMGYLNCRILTPKNDIYPLVFTVYYHNTVVDKGVVV